MVMAREPAGIAPMTVFAGGGAEPVIGDCPQDPHLFDATIRDNLRLARPDATEEELEIAAACARLLPWISSLLLGWDTPSGAGQPARPRTALGSPVGSELRFA